ncbi:MAG: lantibiotic dehydratase [Acidobacteriaceae bacterium]|nr:lantibiotic dehydratase [Acidobacteriaceae bacterium]
MSAVEANEFASAFTHSGFFVIRSPLLPFSELSAWGQGTGSRALWLKGASDECMQQAWEQDARLLRERLLTIVQRPEIEHALYVASGSLQLGIDHWKSNPSDKKSLQAERALIRYFSRMAGRATPFGLFSGCSTGEVGCDESALADLSLAPQRHYRLSCRLDFDYLDALTSALQRDRTIAEALHYWPSASLHRIGNSWHYLESRVVGLNRSHHLVKVEADRYVNAVLGAASSGATLAQLAELIRRLAEPTVTEQQIFDYIHELISQGMLVSSLMPPVTGQPALDDLIAQMQGRPKLTGVAETLSSVRDHLAIIEQKGLTASRQDYTAIASKLETLPARTDTPAHDTARLDTSKLFQVDMVKPVHRAVLTREVLDEILHGVELLCRLYPPIEIEPLKEFQSAFTSRYDRAWVPLQEALDEEIGIGFGYSGRESSPLLRGLHFGAQEKEQATSDIGAVLRRKLLRQSLATGTEVALDSKDLPPINIAAGALPDAFTAIAVLAAPSMDSVRQGDFKLLLKAITGPSGARTFGRFCHADPDLERFVRLHLREEESLRPDAVFAEIVYLPDERMGNVVCRPVLRDYEIVYMGRSGAPLDRQLPLSDLLVSVQNDRIVLRSNRLGKEVVPRMTNAHSFGNPKLPSVYRFLGHLQLQGVSVPNFLWEAAKNPDYLPRVRVGRVVLSAARWHLSHGDIQRLSAREKAARFASMQELRRERNLPRWVTFEQADQTLPVDLDNILAVDAFVHALKRSREANLLELFPGPDELCLEGPEGRFCHELHVPLVRKHAAAEPRREIFPPAVPSAVGRNARSLAPGSDWLFLKLYGGAAALDDALSLVAPVLETAIERRIAAQWFFIRYRDPQLHLRLRFQGEPARLLGELMPMLSAAFSPLLESGTLYKIQLDTYEREIERYGGFEGVLASEQLFCADSDAALEILRNLSGDEGLDRRWRAALLGADMLASDFDLDLRTKRSLMATLEDHYSREFHVSAQERQSVGERFRSLRPSLQTLLDPSKPGELDFARKAFDRRSIRTREVAATLRALSEAGRLNAPIENLLRSYVHMHVNRMLRSDWRQHEVVLYNFLFRLYDGRLARELARPDSI